ncbi:hypothetical protein F528_2117 [Neisseria meningitidis 992008]|nr:hypothetical protein F528_2117 [Neisseria meningitidis 992008]
MFDVFKKIYTTMLASLPGTAMIFLAGLPSMNFTAPSEAAGLSESRINCQ